METTWAGSHAWSRGDGPRRPRAVPGAGRSRVAARSPRRDRPLRRPRVAPGRRGEPDYSPQYPLWSDGATKRRWVLLPPGQTIDASDPDVWDSRSGRGSGRSSVRPRGRDALHGEGRRGSWRSRPTSGATTGARPPGRRGGNPNRAESAPGKRYDMPGASTAHLPRGPAHPGAQIQGAPLSSDRNPGAPHAEAEAPDMWI